MASRNELATSYASQTDVWLSVGLAFVGGYGDAASFVLVKTFTGHVTGNFVLGAISVAAGDGRATFGHLSAIIAFLTGIALSVLIARPLRRWPSWPLLSSVMGIEVILIATACLAFASSFPARTEVFVVCVALALGLQNGAFRRAGGTSVHTTYLTGMVTSFITKEMENYASQVVPEPVRAPDPKFTLFYAIWAAFVLGAGIGAGMVFHFKGFGMLGAAVVLITLILFNSVRSPDIRSETDPRPYSPGAKGVEAGERPQA
jgi:uncharacterized membrane protein YoaK (UPF0700 family)